MNLSDLGYDAWFQQKRAELFDVALEMARITRVDRDRYLVRNERGEIQAEPTGKLLYAAGSSQDLPCVGDWALVQYYNEGSLAIIRDILPRKSFLRRKAPGRNIDYQMVASNIDVAFIVQACDADFNVRRLERYLVMVRDGTIEPFILLSKSDLLAPDELNKRLEEISKAHIDARVIPFSNTSRDGLDTIRKTLVRGKTYCLLGSSGVGKTTLLNALLGKQEFETAPVREKDGKGRHTTSRRQLIIVGDGALLIDTPGLRELGIGDSAGAIDDSFGEIEPLKENCRFKDCTHTVEKGCAVLDALKTGRLEEERYRSYMKLMKEAKFFEMSYVERRRKDKQFGRIINVALKELRKRKPSV
jgi:ribosome biogenesis GTPase